MKSGLLFVTVMMLLLNGSAIFGNLAYDNSRAKKCISWERVCVPAKKCTPEDIKLSKCAICKRYQLVDGNKKLVSDRQACNKLIRVALRKSGWVCDDPMLINCVAWGKECHFKCEIFR